MNNKGFAITGILYTIFILFIMVLLSILAGLNTRKKLLEKSIMSFEDDYKVEELNLQDTSSDTASYTGKYVYSDGSNTCTAYLKKGSSLALENITFVENDCTDKTSLSLIRAYKFK